MSVLIWKINNIVNLIWYSKEKIHQITCEYVCSYPETVKLGGTKNILETWLYTIEVEFEECFTSYFIALALIAATKAIDTIDNKTK